MTGTAGYQRGDRVVLLATTDPYTSLTPGTLGTVTGGDPRHGQVHITWDDGSTLSMLPGVAGAGDRIALAVPHRRYPLPGPDRDALCRYLAGAPGWEFDSYSGTVQVWRTSTGEDRVRVPSPGAPPRVGDQRLLAAADRAIAMHALGIAAREAGTTGPPEDTTGPPEDITDPATGLSRLLAARCSTCILRPGDKMHLGARHTAAFIRHVQAEGTYVVCHQTLTYGDNPGFGPAICRGFADACDTPALRLLRAFGRLLEVDPPQPHAEADRGKEGQ